MIEIFDYIKFLNGIVRKIMKTYILQFYNFKFTVLLTIDWILLLYYENISYSLKKTDFNSIAFLFSRRLILYAIVLNFFYKDSLMIATYRAKRFYGITSCRMLKSRY